MNIYDLLSGNIVVQRVEVFQSDEVAVPLEIHYGLAVRLGNGQLILHSVDHIAHLREEVEILKLPQHAHSLLHHLVIPL